MVSFARFVALPRHGRACVKGIFMMTRTIFQCVHLDEAVDKCPQARVLELSSYHLEVVIYYSMCSRSGSFISIRRGSPY